MNLHSLTYRPDIDGLRALAILPVVLFHAFPKLVPGGFIGVDIFFVISGYLITSILLKDAELKSFNLLHFYKRRILRILPALNLIIFVFLLMGFIFLTAHEYEFLGKHAASGLGFIANLIFWSEAGYFDAAGHSKPLLHLWSLGIEEQFYIVWPLLLYLTIKRSWNIFSVILFVIVLSFTLSMLSIDEYPSAAFYSPLSRSWELAFGAFLAFKSSNPSPNISAIIDKFKSHLSFLGLILILVAFNVVHEERSFPGWWALLPVIGSGLIIISGPQALVNRFFLSNRVMVWFGLISFPLYLWHWPLLSFANILAGKIPSYNIRLLLVLLAIFLSWLTFKYLERKIRNSFDKNKVIRKLLILTFLLFLMSLLVYKGLIPPKNSSPQIAKIYEASTEWEYPGSLEKRQFHGVNYFILPGGPDVTFMFGDSHMDQYAPRVMELSANKNNVLNTVYFFTAGGCFPIQEIYIKGHDGGCSGTRSAMQQMLSRPEVKNVVFSNYWNHYFITRSQPTDQVPLKGEVFFKRNDSEISFRNGGNNLALQELELYFKKISMTKNVFLVIDNPSGPLNNPKYYISGNRFSKIYVSKDIKSHSALDVDQRKLADTFASLAKRSNINIINPLNVLCAKNQCQILDLDGDYVYKDQDHIRPSYVRKNATFIDVAVMSSKR